MLVYTFIIILLFLILLSLGFGLFFLIRDHGQSRRTVKALTVRIGLSVALFVLLLLAYAAGLITKAGWGEPLSGLLIAGVFSALIGFLVSFVIVRVQHLALIMITLGLGLLTQELANARSWLSPTRPQLCEPRRPRSGGRIGLGMKIGCSPKRVARRASRSL